MSTFVALLAVAALFLGVLNLTGVVSPRVATPGWFVPTPASHQRVFVFEVSNDGAVPLEVEAVAWPSRGLDRVELLVVRPGRPGPEAGGSEGDVEPFAPFSLGWGEARTVVLRGDVRCPSGASRTSVEVGAATVRVRTALGLSHDITLASPSPGGHRWDQPSDAWVESAPCP